MPVSTENEPVNLLACDGGGIRGVSELVILDELMKVVQEKGDLAKLPKPCDYFHLMGGTSTGGLVAIMLGRLEMSTEEALKAYDSFASEIFSKRRRSWVEKYKAKTLEQTIKHLVRNQDKGSLLRDARPREAKGRAFVCTMPEQRHRETVCLRTYDIAGDRYPNVLIYQAARATTAATTYFRPMPIRDDEGREEKFVDAALGMNNPISKCLEEAAELYGKQRTLGCLVSLGTGSRHVEMHPHGGKLIRQLKFLGSTIKLMKEIGTDSEKDHERMRVKFADFEDTYFRLNVDGGAQGIELSDWKMIGELKKRTKLYLQSPEVRKSIEGLADVLLQKRPSQGLTLAHGGGLSKETTIPVQQRFVRRGKSSNIFTGRESILKKLDEHFGPRAPGDTSRREFQLHGMGGIGKTQIALKFTERDKQRFHTIMWVDATDAVTIEQSFGDIANNILGREVKKQPVDEVRRWLQQTDKEWLLVFDNAPNSGLSRYLPDGDHGNVLYTTRHRHLQPRLRPECIRSVEQMEIQDAVQLLLASAHIAADVKANIELAKAIVRELGFLPLAIDQAGAYINMAPCPLDRYLQVFNEQKEVLLKSPRFKGADEVRHIAVYTTFNISYRAIKACADKKGDMERVRDAELALKLLRLICFYHNEGHLYAIFAHAAMERYTVDRHKHFPLKAGGVDLEEFVGVGEVQISPNAPDGREWLNYDWYAGIKFLDEYSLIKFDDSVGYSNMHVLVHDWARSRMDDTERLDWGLAARCLLMDSLHWKATKVEHLFHRRDMVPHLEACLRYVDVAHSDPALESEYQARMARVFRQSNNLEAAKTSLQRALKHRRESFGLLHPVTFTAISELALVYKDLGNFAQAEELLLEVIDRRRLLYREKQWEALQKAPATSIEMSTLEAHTFYSEALLEDLKLRKDTLDLLIVLLDQDSRKAADGLLVDFIRWEESRLGKHDSQMDTWQRYRDQIQNLGKIQDLDGDEREPRLVEKARQDLKLTTASKGPLDQRTMFEKFCLGRLLVSDGNLLKDEAAEEAQDLMLEVLEWRAHVHGKDSLEYLEAVVIIVQLLLRMNRVYEADSICMLVLAKYAAILGQRHPQTLDSLEKLARCFAGQAEYQKAVASMKICLAGRDEVLGPEHIWTQLSRSCIRKWQHLEETMSEDARAEMRRKAVGASRKGLGDDVAELRMRQWEPVELKAITYLFAPSFEPTRPLRVMSAQMHETSSSETLTGHQVMVGIAGGELEASIE